MQDRLVGHPQGPQAGGLVDAPDSVFRLQVSEGARLVLVLLWRYAGADREPVVWPSKATLAERTGMAERSIARILVALRAAGAIERCDRPASAQVKGPAWRLNGSPDDPSVMTARSYDPPVTDPSVTPTVTERSPPYDPPVTPPMTDGSPEPTKEPPVEPTMEPPVLFALDPLPAKRASKSKAPAAGCTDEQWASVLGAYARARDLGGMPAQWGAYRDTVTNRGHAARIFREGYSEADLTAVLEHIGRGLAQGSHDPKWTSLEHVARTMGRYLHEAAAGPAAPRSRGAINPLCTPVQRPPRPRDAPAEVYEYLPQPKDEFG